MGLTGSQRAEKVGFTYTPTNYIPVPVYSESTNKVSAHLKGIDNALVGSGAVSAVNVPTDTSNFDQILSSADTNVQLALETLDSLGGYFPLSASAVGVVTDNFDDILSSADDTVQKAFDTLDDHDHYSEGLFEDRPAPSTEGRWYNATDNRQLFIDNGTQWREVAALGTSAPTIYERHVATAAQTVFDLSSHYDVGVNALQVYVNGERQTVGASNDYVETDSDTITFNAGLNASDEVIFLQHAGGAKSIITARTDFTATGGQTEFNLSFSYRPGYQDILVYSSGVVQRVGASYDYLETDETTVTFNSGRALNEQIAIIRIGSNDAGTVGLYDRHVATAGQTVFNLAGAYPTGTNALLVFKNGALLSVTADYTETDGDTVTLTAPANLSDVLIFRIPYGDTEVGTGGPAINVTTDTSNFDQILSSADTTVQAALETLDSLGGYFPLSASAVGVATDDFDDFILTSADDTVQKALDTLDDHDHYVEGLFSNRPAAGIEGRWYYATDTGILYADNGIAWREVSANVAASAVSVATSGFGGFILDSDDDTAQKAFDTLDDHDHYVEGLLDDRPAFGIDGRWYRATDTGQLFVDNGSSWNEVAAIGTGAPTLYERHVATAAQTVFDLSTNYDTGVNALQVYRNGNRQTVGATNDYVETDSDTVTFNVGLDASDEVIFIQFSGGAKTVITARADFAATAGQTVFDLPFTYRPGYQDIQVYSGGLIQRLGGSYDYLETDADTITFNVGRVLNENVTVLKMGGNEAGTVGLYEKHVATAAQTVFNLTGTYPVGTHSLLVFQEGALLTIGDDYTETDADTVTLTVGATVSDVLLFRVMNGDTELSAHDIDYHSDYPTGLHPYEASTAGVGSPNILLDSESGLTVSNVGAGAENYNTLPSAVAGLKYTFICENANGIRATAAAGDTVRVGSNVSAAAGYARATTVGNAVTLVAVDSTQWIATSVVGVWTVV